MSAKRPSLNPAFKRFQYLPHPPPAGPGQHACAAPRVAELATLAEERNLPRTQDQGLNFGQSWLGGENPLAGPSREFQTPA